MEVVIPVKKIPWYRRIQFQIPVVVFLTFLIPSLVFIFYDHMVSRRTALQNMQSAVEERLNRTALLMQKMMQEIEGTAKTLSEDEVFLDALSDYLSQPEDRTAQSRLLLMMGQTAWPCSFMESMYLAAYPSPIILSSDPERKRIDADAGGKDILEKGAAWQTGWSSFGREGDEKSIVYWRTLSNPPGENGSVLGCVLKTEYLQQGMAELQNQKESLNLITDYQGNVLYRSSRNASYSDDFDGMELFQNAYSEHENAGSYFSEDQSGRWLVVYYNSLEDGWKYISAIPEQQVYEQETDLRLLAVLLGAGVFSIVFGSMILHWLVIYPLGHLQSQMERMEQGQLEVMEPVRSQNEIGLVLRSYNHMIEQLKRLIDENYVQQLLRKQAELSSLQSQIDEHFLYNTLNTVYCKASEEGAAVSATMILRLSQYFRISLSKGQEKIPLNEILELIQAYLQIQQMRFGQRLVCHLDVLPDMDSYVSLKWLYQPIVENAVIHGFERKLGSHTLDICFRAVDGTLQFIVRDDGIGMSEETRRQVTAQINAFDPVQGKGYALRNMKEQIRIAYGDPYGIQIDSCPGQGTTVILTVPLERRSS